VPPWLEGTAGPTCVARCAPRRERETYRTAALRQRCCFAAAEVTRPHRDRWGRRRGLQAWRQVGAGRDDRRKLTNVRRCKTASGAKSMPIWRSRSQPPKRWEGKKEPDCCQRPASRRLSRVIGPDMGSEENVVPPLRFGEEGSRWLSHRLTAQSRRCAL
jgi:hypothetical protein